MEDTDLPELHVKDTYRASNGVLLKLKKVPRLLLTDAIRKQAPPKVPTWFNEDKGRDEENPADPAYVEALQAFNIDRGLMSVTMTLAMGTSIIDVPAGIEPYDSETWVADLNDMGMGLDLRTPRMRYTAWLKYIALPGDEFNDVVSAVMRYSGLISEEDVAAAQRAFRGDGAGPEHNGTVVTAEGGPGDNIGELPGVRAGVGGA